MRRTEPDPTHWSACVYRCLIYTVHTVSHIKNAYQIASALADCKRVKRIRAVLDVCEP
jgi:hypothetical protein